MVIFDLFFFKFCNDPCICQKGCTHSASILCNGAVDSHQKQLSKAVTQWEYLFFAIFAIFDVKNN